MYACQICYNLLWFISSHCHHDFCPLNPSISFAMPLLAVKLIFLSGDSEMFECKPYAKAIGFMFWMTTFGHKGNEWLAGSPHDQVEGQLRQLRQNLVPKLCTSGLQRCIYFFWSNLNRQELTLNFIWFLPASNHPYRKVVLLCPVCWDVQVKGKERFSLREVTSSSCNTKRMQSCTMVPPVVKLWTP